ncbi:MAG: aminoglycoside phosphotransferase family protein, partial [Candidatus Eremiobacteraeota bacterium]|nr:aminoglycoside phosphotransferase family protein [Candidatus Eremiobacteraeota bacterium]
MPPLTRKNISEYLSRLTGKKVNVINFGMVGHTEKSEKDVKGYSYGAPVLIEYEAGRKKARAVLSTQTPSTFGHDFAYDRAHGMLESYDTFNKLPRHVKVIDVGAFLKDGSLVSLGDYDEFFVVTEFVQGEE